MNVFREPCEPFGLFSYSVIAILLILNILVIWALKNNMLKYNSLFKALLAICFFIIIPFVSMKIEISNVFNKFEIVDGFNLLYIYFKFPVWWIIGTLNIFLFLKIINKKIS